jgi:hypothetical protein
MLVLIIAAWFCWLALGIALIGWARRFSVRYNAWTTSFRERHPNINPPPTREMRELNTNIMTGLFCFLGMVFCATAIWFGTLVLRAAFHG